MVFALLPLNSRCLILNIILDPRGRLFGHFWGTSAPLLEHFWAHGRLVGHFWAIVDAHWRLMEHFWNTLGHFWIHFGLHFVTLAPHGSLLAHFGRIWEHFGLHFALQLLLDTFLHPRCSGINFLLKKSEPLCVSNAFNENIPKTREKLR